MDSFNNMYTNQRLWKSYKLSFPELSFKQLIEDSIDSSNGHNANNPKYNHFNANHSSNLPIDSPQNLNTIRFFRKFEQLLFQPI